MNYDPIKDRLGAIFNLSPVLQRLFYRLLGLFFLRSWYVKREVRALMQATGGNAHVLDAGTGFGQYTWWILRRWDRAKVLAVDVKEDYLAAFDNFLRSQGMSGRVQLQVCDLTQTTFDPDIDLILSVDVMEHIEDDRAVFRNFERSLKPGGFVLINTPSDLGGSDVGSGNEESFIGEHVRDGYNRAELEQKLRDAGLNPVKSIYTYGTPGSAAWSLLIKWPMLLLHRSFGFLILLPFYYAITLIPSLILNRWDMSRPNSEGTGLIVIAQKPS